MNTFWKISISISLQLTFNFLRKSLYKWTLFENFSKNIYSRIFEVSKKIWKKSSLAAARLTHNERRVPLGAQPLSRQNPIYHRIFNFFLSICNIKNPFVFRVLTRWHVWSRQKNIIFQTISSIFDENNLQIHGKNPLLKLYFLFSSIALRTHCQTEIVIFRWCVRQLVYNRFESD